jgi:hypothetical protein
MIDKIKLLAKIDGLLLATDDHKHRLRRIVESLQSDQELSALSQLVLQEDHIIQDVLRAIIETELEAGDEHILQVIDDCLRDVKAANSQATHLQEGSERVQDVETAEKLLDNLE